MTFKDKQRNTEEGATGPLDPLDRDSKVLFLCCGQSSQLLARRRKTEDVLPLFPPGPSLNIHRAQTGFLEEDKQPEGKKIKDTTGCSYSWLDQNIR